MSRSTNIKKKKARQRGCEKQLRRLFSLLVNYVKHHKRVGEKTRKKRFPLRADVCVSLCVENNTIIHKEKKKTTRRLLCKMTRRIVQFKSKAESHRALHSIASCCFFFFLVSDTLLLSSNVCYGIAHTHGRKKKKKKKTRQDIRERENTHTHIRRQPCLNSCITSFFFFYSSFHSVTHTNRGRERERETKKSE